MIKSRRMRWVRHVAHIREMRNEYRIFFGEPERKRRLGRHMHRLRYDTEVFLMK
jgi:hypothetical protein